MLTQPESMSASVTSEPCDRHLIEHRLSGITPHLFSGQTIHKESLLQSNQPGALHGQVQTQKTETMARETQSLSLENTVATYVNWVPCV